MLTCKSPHCQRAHTVSHQDQRKIREIFADVMIYFRNVLEHSLCSATVHISEIIFGTDTPSMSSVVMDHGHKSLFCKIFHKWYVTFLVFTHPVNKLNDRPIRLLLRADTQN